jgi:hypothetical protein
MMILADYGVPRSIDKIVQTLPGNLISMFDILFFHLFNFFFLFMSSAYTAPEIFKKEKFKFLL